MFFFVFLFFLLKTDIYQVSLDIRDGGGGGGILLILTGEILYTSTGKSEEAGLEYCQNFIQNFSNSTQNFNRFRF